MFTGIIKHVGSVKDVRKTAGGARLTIDIGPLASGLGIGDSMAVNGVCLTASVINGTVADFDAVAETVENSTTGKLRSGSRVNLEPAMPADGRFDGHIVQGHVDGTATIRRLVSDPDPRIEFTAGNLLPGGTTLSPKALDLVAHELRKSYRGRSVVDGVSLTIASLEKDAFSVAIIPTTMAETTLSQLAEGQEVNIETDVLGKYVRRYLQNILSEAAEGTSGGLTIEKLRESGFI